MTIELTGPAASPACPTAGEGGGSGRVAAAQGFTRAMQASLTRAEVADAYLRSVHGVIAASAVGFYQLHRDLGTVLEVHARVPSDFLVVYERYGRDNDPVLDHVIGTRQPMDSSRLAAEAWRRSGACHALGGFGYEHSLEAPVVVSGHLFGTINFARTADDPAFSDDDLLAAAVIADHLGLAIERALRFEQVVQRADVFEGALNRVPQAAVVSDLSGAVIFKNRAADQEWASTSNGDDAGSWQHVETAIAEASRQVRETGRRVVLSEVRLPDGGTCVGKTVKLAERTDATLTTLVSRSDEGSASCLPVWDVLTRREREIAQLVSEGLSTKDIAERAFISQNTVKQHLKRVFTKTDVRSRAELVQLIWSSAASVERTSA